MSTIKIFLASSSELESDRKEFEIFLSRKTKLWKDERDIFLELLNWEDFIDAMSKTRLQDRYNKAIEESDIFVMLFWTKVGIYTNEEFEVAHSNFLKTGKPLIYTYFKDTASARPKEESLEIFNKKIEALKHFKTVYTNIEGLLLHFNLQLDKVYRLTAPDGLQQRIQTNLSKDALNKMISRLEVQEVFEELIKIFHDDNIRLNVLMDEYINQSNNFNLAQYLQRLKLFISKYLN